MTGNLTEQGKEIEGFLNSAFGDVSRSIAKVFSQRGTALKKSLLGQLRTNFKAGKAASKESRGFFNGVRQKDIPPQNGLGPATFVRMGTPFIRIFEEGGTVAAQGKFLIILLPDGARLNFGRINKGNKWEDIYKQQKKYLSLVRLSDGSILVLFQQNNGIKVPIYKFQRQVKLSKRISFFEEAERIANTTPELIQQELDK